MASRRIPSAAVAQHRDACAQQWTLPRDHRRLRAPRHPRHLAVARPGRARRASRKPRSASATRDSTVTGLCRGGMFPRRDARGPRAALDDNRRAIDEALALGARCLVLVVGGLPKDASGSPRRRTSPARARWCATASASCSTTRGRRGMPLAIEPLHPMYAADRACVNTLAQALDLCDALAPERRRRRSASRSTSITSGGIPLLEAQIARAGARRPPARLSHLRLARADDRPAERPRHDGRRRHRPAAHPRLDGSRRLSRHARGRDLFRRELVEARPRRGAGHLPASVTRTARRVHEAGAGR